MAQLRRLGGRGTWSFFAGFEPRDLWVGAYWKFERHSGFVADTLDIYVCLIPTLVFLFARERSVYDVAR